MRPALLALFLVAGLATPARADLDWCFTYERPVLPSGSIVPRHARLAFRTNYMHENDPLTATISGTPVQITRSKKIVPPFYLVTAVIESDLTGELVVTFGKTPPLHYTITADPMPTQIPATVARANSHLALDDEEEFTGFAIRLPVGTPALFGELKFRDAADQPWQSIEVPLYSPPSDPRPAIRIGEFCGSDRNVDLRSFEHAFDVEVSVTLADATVVPVTGLAKRMTMPEALPPQPRPRNQRR